MIDVPMHSISCVVSGIGCMFHDAANVDHVFHQAALGFTDEGAYMSSRNAALASTDLVVLEAARTLVLHVLLRTGMAWKSGLLSIVFGTVPSSVCPCRCLWMTSPCDLPNSVLSDCSDSRHNMFSQVIPAALSVSVLSGTARKSQSRTIEAKV